MRFPLRPTAPLVRFAILGCVAGGMLLSLGGDFFPAASVAQGGPADKPTSKEKGKPTGEVHGGADGQPFKDRAWGRLAEVTVRGGSWLDSVRCTWEDEGDLVKSDNHGGDGGEATVIKLEPGESLIQVAGVVLKQDDLRVIGSLSFKTTKRTIEPIGETTEGPKFTLDAPPGQEICGFQGRSGDYLNAIGMICRPKS